jgi:hypothetical protein
MFLDSPAPIASDSKAQTQKKTPLQNWQFTETTLVAE